MYDDQKPGISPALSTVSFRSALAVSMCNAILEQHEVVYASLKGSATASFVPLLVLLDRPWGLGILRSLGGSTCLRDCQEGGALLAVASLQMAVVAALYQ